MSTPGEEIGADTDDVGNLVAFQGTVEILNATWSLDSGRTVELRLCGDAYDRVHPFKRFQKKRNGRVGTRFQAAFSRVDTGDQVLSMEVMLAAWKDSSSIGQSITLWLDDEIAVHPFCGCQRRKAQQPGELFALVLVELNDDDSPVNQSRSDRGATENNAPDTRGAGQGDQTASGVTPGAAPGGAGARGPSGRGKNPGPRKLSSSVHLLVTSPIFLRWLQETKGTLVKEWTTELARRYVKKVIQVESLGDLDRDQAAVKRYHDEIRRPFERWRYQEP